MDQLRAREDFDAARYRSFRKAISAALTRRIRRLVSLDEVLSAARRQGQSYRGVREIPLDRVVGSAEGAKAQDFDATFLPTTRRLRDRWSRIYEGVLEGAELPPIDVYQVSGSYYVIDGHHRVSVHRALGNPRIKARVTEVATRAPLASGDAAELLRAAEYVRFLETTHLDQLRPEARLEVSRLGRYDEILQHILGHRYFLGLEQRRDIPLPDAASSWYDSVYRPVAEAIRRHHVLDQLPGWTEADLYVEITRRWLELSQTDQPSGAHAAVHALLEDKDQRRWWRRRRATRI